MKEEGMKGGADDGTIPNRRRETRALRRQFLCPLGARSVGLPGGFAAYCAEA